MMVSQTASGIRFQSFGLRLCDSRYYSARRIVHSIFGIVPSTKRDDKGEDRDFQEGIL